MVDERRARRILQRVSNDVSFLAARATIDRDQLLADPVHLAAIKYMFITAIEGCVDVAQHVSASEGWGPPSSNADAIREIARHDVLSHELGDAVARAVGFRNVLVHGYVDVDDRLVVEQLDRLKDLVQFVSSVSRWIESQRS